MLKYLLPLIFSSLLFSSSLSTTKERVPLNQPFLVTDSQGGFDNSITYTHQKLLNCSPSLDAVYKVESEKQLKVIPKELLQAGTTYSCTYNKRRFSFKSVDFALLGATYFKREKMFRLEFNNPIDQKSINRGITVTKLNKLTKTKLKYSVTQSDSRHILLKINEPLNQHAVRLEINSQFKSAYGKSLAKSYSELYNRPADDIELDSNKKRLTFKDKPIMVALDNGEFALRIFTNDDLTEKSKNAIEIEGIENFDVSESKYIDYDLRQKYNIEDTYYYHDVTSKEFKPNHSYHITLKKGLGTYYRELKEPLEYTLKTGDRQKSILFDANKPYISNSGELSFSSVNVQKATLIVERILDDNLRYFLNFDNANEEQIDPLVKEVFRKDLSLNQKRNILLKQKFKLSNLSKKALPVGVYKVSLHFTIPSEDEEEPQERVASKVLFLSNLGISANLAKDEAFVTVLSLDTAQPVENAKVEIYAKNNELIATGQTNKDGMVLIKKSKLIEQNPVGIIVQTKSDRNFLALNASIGSPTLKEILQKPQRFKSYVYFQSNIVRPASKVHALISVKDRDFISASKLPVKVVFKEMYGKRLHEKIYHTDEYGLIDFSYQLDNNDKTGNYLLQVFMGDENIGSKKLKVEAFMPPKIENTIKTNKQIYYIDDLMEVNISSSYLFGAPSSNLQGKVSLNARPIDYVNRAYKNYNFVNQRLAKENITSYLDYHEDIVLDEKGKFSMVIKNHLTQQVPSILEAMIGATIMDDSQPVSTYKKVKIYPYKAMVGLKLNADSFEKGEELKGKAVLIDPITSKEIMRPLYVQIKRVRWHYDYRSGNYHWEKEISVVDSFTITSGEEFSRKVLENGDYIIEVSDRLGGHSVSSNFDVWWWSYSNISPNNDLKSVTIDFEDKLYSRGDNIEVKIKSPILEGQLLLILEGERFDNYKRVAIHKGVAKTSIEIKNDIGRGLYLHAIAIRDSKSDSKLIPFRAMGYKFVKPNRDAHKIKVELTLPKVTKSKVKLPIRVKTSKPSKVLISIVDRGILQLVDQKQPKIFDYFNEKPSAKVSYYDLYDQLLAYIAKGKLVDFGAGDSLSKKQKHLAPDLGKRIKPFMIWSGIVDVKEGETTLNIDIPEFNGRASVVAIAINQDSIGVSGQDISVKDDVMIKPSYPRFSLVGDEILVPIRIFNTTKSDKSVTLSVKSSSNLVLELKESELSVPANSSKKIMAKLSPSAKGKGEITLTAKYDQTAVTKSVELPIFSPYALSTKTFKGIANRPQSFTIPKEYKDAKVYITLSDNLIGALRDDLRYLVQYPYGCAEQTSSKLSAMNFAKPFLKNDKLVKESDHFILQGVKKLDNMQNYYGEFNYWEGGSHVHAYASLYAAQTLLDIEEAGGPVKADFKKKIVKMLNSVATANGKYDASYSDFHRIYAGYILAEHHLLSKSIANMLYEKKIYKGHFLATFYMSAILKEQGESDKANKLFYDNSYELSRYAYKTYGNRTGNFESNVRDMMLHFIVKTKYFNKDAKDLVAIQKEFSNLYSTQTKAVALKAISTYLGHPTSSKLNVTVDINGQKSNYKKPKLIVVEKVESPTIELNPNGLAMSYSIELVKNTPHALSNELDEDKELSIKRQFIDENGEKVDLNNLTQGDKIFSRVTVSNYGKINQVVINQRIPACFEIVNNNIKEKKARFENENMNIEHKEIRDDRILHFVNLPKKSVWNTSLRKDEIIQNIGSFYSEFVASSIGECKLPAVITEAMYDTRINDYAKEANKVVVKPKLNTKKHKVVKPKPTVVTSVKKEVKKEPKKESLAEKAKALVKEIYTREMHSNNPLEFVEFFSFPLEIYFRTKDFKKDELIADKRKYFKDWSKRVYTHIKTTIESEEKQKKEFKVKVTFNYKIYNGKKVLKGVSNHLLTVVQKDNKMVVVAVELWKKKK